MTKKCIPISGAAALVLGGGGARGAYQAGVIQAIARRYPELEFPILTGISAGAINTAFLAAHGKTFAEAADDLVDLWLSVTPDQVYRVDAGSLVKNVFRWGGRLLSGGLTDSGNETRGLVDTVPLRRLLSNALSRSADDAISGIDDNIARGRLHAVALSATSYSTGQAVTWVQGSGFQLWQRPQRRSEMAQLGVGHVLASTALPLLFPAVRVGRDWYGDGGIRQTAPLSPALHLGAGRILTISTRRARTRAEADVSQIAGYPPPAQVLGVLYNAVFLDLIDQDILRLKLINRLLRTIPEYDRRGLREVDILVMRPSQDLGKLARQYEPRLPAALRFMTRGWGTRRTTSPDVLSLVMFQPDYVRALIELGGTDVAAQTGRIEAFLRRAGAEVAPPAPGHALLEEASRA
jgi:NTE family protein